MIKNASNFIKLNSDYISNKTLCKGVKAPAVPDFSNVIEYTNVRGQSIAQNECGVGVYNVAKKIQVQDRPMFTSQFTNEEVE